MKVHAGVIVLLIHVITAQIDRRLNGHYGIALSMTAALTFNLHHCHQRPIRIQVSSD